MRYSAKEFIEQYEMQPLPYEGGYFVETYKNTEYIASCFVGNRYDSDRSLAGAICYLITPETYSNWHRLKSDEIWFFQYGDVAEQLQIHPDGTLRRVLIGSNIRAGESHVCMVPKNVWQRTRLLYGGELAFYSVMTSPAFEYADWEHATVPEMKSRFPQHKAILD